ncbi:unnamed protein product [Closterium sp. Yama58-4]|nr:unnamed protein product [Closterium sp. Yama58-4]
MQHLTKDFTEHLKKLLLHHWASLRSRVHLPAATGYLGVTLKAPGRYQARMLARDGTRQRHVGFYATAEEAALAYDVAVLRVHGAQAKLNFPADERRGEGGKEAPSGGGDVAGQNLEKLDGSLLSPRREAGAEAAGEGGAEADGEARISVQKAAVNGDEKGREEKDKGLTPSEPPPPGVTSSPTLPPPMLPPPMLPPPVPSSTVSRKVRKRHPPGPRPSALAPSASKNATQVFSQVPLQVPAGQVFSQVTSQVPDGQVFSEVQVGSEGGGVGVRVVGEEPERSAMETVRVTVGEVTITGAVGEVCVVGAVEGKEGQKQGETAAGRAARCQQVIGPESNAVVVGERSETRGNGQVESGGDGSGGVESGGAGGSAAQGEGGRGRGRIRKRQRAGAWKG